MSCIWPGQTNLTLPWKKILAHLSNGSMYKTMHGGWELDRILLAMPNIINDHFMRQFVLGKRKRNVGPGRVCVKQSVIIFGVVSDMRSSSLTSLYGLYMRSLLKCKSGFFFSVDRPVSLNTQYNYVRNTLPESNRGQKNLTRDRPAPYSARDTLPESHRGQKNLTRDRPASYSAWDTLPESHQGETLFFWMEFKTPFIPKWVASGRGQTNLTLP